MNNGKEIARIDKVDELQPAPLNNLVEDVKAIIDKGLERVCFSVNQAMLNAYWNGKANREEGNTATAGQNMANNKSNFCRWVGAAVWLIPTTSATYISSAVFYLTFSNLEDFERAFKILNGRISAACCASKMNRRGFGICKRRQMKVGVRRCSTAISTHSISVVFWLCRKMEWLCQRKSANLTNASSSKIPLWPSF